MIGWILWATVIAGGLLVACWDLISPVRSSECLFCLGEDVADEYRIDCRWCKEAKR